MRLARHGSIHALFREFEPAKRPQHRREPANPVRHSGIVGARCCTCGTCKECLENARWERIFDEKFADPDYYAPRVTSIASSLTSIR